MKKYFDILQKSALFAHIRPEDLSGLLGCLGAKWTHYEKKETILAEGEPAKSIGILLDGTAQVVIVDYFGNRSIVSEVAPGESFGESFACAEVPAVPVNVIANEPCEVVVLDCARVLHSCSNACDFHRQIIFNLMKDVATKNIQFHQKLEITAKRSTREKLMTYLMYQAKKAGSSQFDIPFDRQELADYLEVERSGLSAEISRMRADGLIRNQKNHFELLHKPL